MALRARLFGKNTVAGAINISSASPCPEMRPRVKSMPRSKKTAVKFTTGTFRVARYLRARLALRYRETDGYVYNAYLEQDEGALDETGGRLTLVWQPSDTFSANMKYTNMQRDRDGAASATLEFLSPSSECIRCRTDLPSRALLTP